MDFPSLEDRSGASTMVEQCSSELRYGPLVHLVYRSVANAALLVDHDLHEELRTAPVRIIFGFPEPTVGGHLKAFS
jgi:hypothetical protein